MKNIIFFLIISMLYVSCTNCSSNNNNLITYNTGNEELIKIDDISFEDDGIIDLIDSISIIKLQSDECLIGEIMQVILTPKNIFVYDDYKGGSVVIFNAEGTYIKRLQTGRGRGEINGISRISYNDGVLTTYQFGAINQFSSNGTFIKSFEYMKLIKDCEFYKDKYVCIQIEQQNVDGEFRIIKENNNFNEEHPVFFVPQSRTYALLCEKYLHYDENGNLLITRPFDNNIYLYNDTLVNVKYVLNIGKLEMRDYNFTKFEDFRNKVSVDKYYFTGNFFTTKNYHLFRFADKGHQVDVYYNKVSGKCRCLHYYYYDDKKNYYHNKKIINIGKNVTATSDCFVSYLDFGMLSEDDKGSILSINSISPTDKLKIQNLKEDDNPLIVLYRLKDL